MEESRQHALSGSLRVLVNGGLQHVEVFPVVISVSFVQSLIPLFVIGLVESCPLTLRSPWIVGAFRTKSVAYFPAAKLGEHKVL